MRGFLLTCLFFGAPMVFPGSRGQGFLDWHWNFDQGTYRAGPSDSISLQATIFVRPESPGPLTGRVLIDFHGSLFAVYDFDCAFCGDIRLADASIPPGGSLSFNFGTLTPKAPIAPGEYRSFPDQPFIELTALGTRHIASDPLVIQIVPEPSAATLTMMGALIIAATTRKRQVPD